MTGATWNHDGSPDSQMLTVTLLASLQHFLLFFLLSKIFLLLVHNTHPPNTYVHTHTHAHTLSLSLNFMLSKLLSVISFEIDFSSVSL